MRILEKQYKYAPQPEFSKQAGVCQVCGETYRARSWKCGIREDGILAVCSKKYSDTTDKFGRYIHIVEKDKSNERLAKPVIAKENHLSEIASSEKLNRIYRAFLQNLELTEIHADSLLCDRRLSDTTIAYNLYASLPKEDAIEKTLNSVLAVESDLKGCAGFYLDNFAEWKMKSYYGGFFIPCRNLKGQIISLQIRLDKPIDDNKYIWFSSSNKSNGALPKIDLHYAKPDLIRQTGRLIITEGLLKADICAEKLDCAVAGISGSGISLDAAKKYIEDLKKEFPMVNQISLAPDADWKEKEGVRRAFLNLLQAASEIGIKTNVLRWEKELGKGLDDVLNAGIFKR